MPEEIFPDLFRIKVPLPDSPLKYLNSYVIRAEKRSLIIDTGLNRDECEDALRTGLGEIGVNPEDADIFVTHLHADHFGLIPRLAGSNTRFFFNRPDAELVENWQGFEPMIRYAAKNGFPEEILRSAVHQHPGYKFGTDWIPALNILSDGDVIEYGQYSLSCVHTPGHTRGHTCLYDAKNRFFIAGDHILEDITPNIQCWSDGINPLKDYMESLDKVRGFDVSLVLPGHRRIFSDFTGRIDTLKAHHEARLVEVEAILQRKSPQTAYSVASQMTWDIFAATWEEFPVAQKWFATGEAISHLRYLEKEGRISCTEADGLYYYSA